MKPYLTSRDLKTIGLAQTQLTRDAKKRLETGRQIELRNKHVEVVQVTRTVNGLTILCDYETESGEWVRYEFHVIHHQNKTP